MSVLNISGSVCTTGRLIVFLLDTSAVNSGTALWSVTYGQDPTGGFTSIIPSNGGQTGGLMTSGLYYAVFTETNASGESRIGNESSVFRVQPGYIPQVKFPALQLGNSFRNLYMTPIVGMPNNSGLPGTEILYATGIGTTFFSCSGILPVSGQTAPTCNTSSADPMIFVNGTGIQLRGGIFSSSFPFVAYPISGITIASGDTIKYSAMATWLKSGSNTAPAASLVLCNNYAGQDMPFTIPNWTGVPYTLSPVPRKFTMQLGVNHQDSSVAQALRNLVRTPGTNWSSANVDPNYGFRISGSNLSEQVVKGGATETAQPLGMPAITGYYRVVWDDYNVPFNGQAWLTGAGTNETTISPDASHLTPFRPALTSGYYPNCYEDFAVSYNALATVYSMSTNINASNSGIRNIRVYEPSSSNDPLNTDVVTGYFKNVGSGIRCIRFVQCGDGINSNVSTTGHRRQLLDDSIMWVRTYSNAITSVTMISGGSFTWNNSGYPITDKSTCCSDLGGNQACLRFSLKNVPHQFYTGQKIKITNLKNITQSQNGTFAVSGAPSAQQGCMLSDNSTWEVLNFPGGGPMILSTGSGTIDLAWGSTGGGLLDPSGTQFFDTSSGNSVISLSYPNTHSFTFREMVFYGASMSSDIWINMPTPADDICITDIANECLQAVIDSNFNNHIYVEYGNENWNSLFSQYTVMRYLDKPFGLNNQFEMYAYRANQIHNIFNSVFSAAGRSTMCKRLFCGQHGNSLNTLVNGQMIIFCANNGIVIDAFADASYYGLPASGPGVLADDAFDYIDPAAIHDYWEWVIGYDPVHQSFIGGPQSKYGTKALLLSYFPNAEYVGYEGGLDDCFPQNMSNMDGVGRDFFYHPRMDRTCTMIYASMEAFGYLFLNKYNWASDIATSTNWYRQWGMMGWGNQQPGVGTGNYFNTIAPFVPAGHSQDLLNVSPQLNAWRKLLTFNSTPLSGVSVFPGSSTVYISGVQQYALSGTYFDGSIKDLTGTSNWYSSNNSLATINSAGLATGLVSGVATIVGVNNGLSGVGQLYITVPGLSGINVVPTGKFIDLSAKQQFQSLATFVDGSVQDITSLSTWSSSNTVVATINSAGLSTGVNSGVTTIAAKFSSMSGLTNLNVFPLISGIVIAPLNVSIYVSGAQQYVASGTYSNHATYNVTNSATWRSSSTSKATINSAGLGTGVSAGTTIISATQAGVSGTTNLTVTNPSLSSITVTPTGQTVFAGITKQFTSIGTFVDNTTQNLTTLGSWSVDNAFSAISSLGLASGVSSGSTNIISTFGGVSGYTLFNVLPPALTKVIVFPGNATIEVSGFLQYAATGIYTNLSFQDITNAVTWQSSSAVAQISVGGLAEGFSPGNCLISALQSAISGVTQLTVKAAPLVSIAVTPADISLNTGDTQQYTAIGTFDDGSLQNLTTLATWNSLSPAIAMITTGGLATAVHVGSTSITAQFASKLGSTSITVVTPSPTPTPTPTPTPSPTPVANRLSYVCQPRTLRFTVNRG